MKTLTIVSSLGALLLFGCTGTEGRSSLSGNGPGTEHLTLDDEDDEAMEAEEGEEEEAEEQGEEGIALSQVPQMIKDAAIAAVPGLVLSEAEKEGDRYCLHGTAKGVFHEVEVSFAGKVLDVESGEEHEE